jgi:hypothetical protein
VIGFFSARMGWENQKRKEKHNKRPIYLCLYLNGLLLLRIALLFSVYPVGKPVWKHGDDKFGISPPRLLTP